MLKGIVAPKIARQQRCNDCGHLFRPGYYDFDITCQKCGSKNLRYVWFDRILDIIKFLR